MLGITQNIGVAIVGCGYWGRNYVRVFDELPTAQVKVICDQDNERLTEVGRRYPEAALTTDLFEAINREDVSVVVISTTASTHYDVARACLLADKHVLIEKPLATSVEDAEKMVELAEQRDLTLMVGHTFLYNPSIHKVKELVEEEKMGNVYYLYSCRTNLGPIRHDVDALWDLAPHDISIFNFLLNRRPRWVSAVGANVLKNSRADVGFITLGYDEGLVGNIHVSWADPNKVRELVVVGSQRRVVFDDMSAQEPVKAYDKGISPADESDASFGEIRYKMRNGDIFSPNVQSSEPLKNQCKHFLNCVVNHESVITDGHDGLDVVRVMAAIDESVSRNGAPVPLVYPENRTNGHYSHLSPQTRSV